MHVLNAKQTQLVGAGTLNADQVHYLFLLGSQSLMRFGIEAAYMAANRTPAGLMANFVLIPFLQIVASAIGSEVFNQWQENKAEAQ